MFAINDALKSENGNCGANTCLYSRPIPASPCSTSTQHHSNQNRPLYHVAVLNSSKQLFRFLSRYRFFGLLLSLKIVFMLFEEAGLSLADGGEAKKGFSGLETDARGFVFLLFCPRPSNPMKLCQQRGQQSSVSKRGLKLL
jgi:hypothetical protein